MLYPQEFDVIVVGGGIAGVATAIITGGIGANTAPSIVAADQQRRLSR